MNDRAALEILLDVGPLSRSGIVRELGVSRPTASQVVTRLESSGLIEPHGTAQGARGPLAVTYSVRMDVIVGLALDVDPDGIDASVVDVAGRELGSARINAGPGRDAATDVRQALTAACANAGVPESRVGVVVIGLQAAADPATGDISLVGHLPGWPRTGLRDLVENEIRIPVLLENDVNLAAIAEHHHASPSESSFSLLWLGQGIGLGSWIGDDLHRGASGAAGEIGYLPIAAEVADLDDSTIAQDLIGGRRVISLAHDAGIEGTTLPAVLAGLRENKDARRTVVEALAPRVASVLRPVVAVMQPALLVIGGPVGICLGAELADAIDRELEGTELRVPLAPSLVPDAPALAGARAVAAARVREGLLTHV
ncbi:ROK family transcriptional regulator [Paraoerskovia marina]|nr:ROK family transcriptional regulator [Paraoerskovia marina]